MKIARDASHASGTPSSRGQAKLARFSLFWRLLSQNLMAMVGLGVVILLAVVALLGPVLSPHDPYAQDLAVRLMPPNMSYWFGTDELGRDIFSRVLHGARITLSIVVLVAVIAAPFGLILGCVSGYRGGWFDLAIMRITDIFLAFPRLILALAFVAALGPGIENAVIAIALTSWPVYARVARAETLLVRSANYVSAARLQGASSWRVIRRYVIPMCVNSMVVRVTLDMAGIILTAAGLGFLGLGAKPPSPEWGAMIANGRQYLFDQWWLATMPGLAILFVSLGFNLLGDGLRDAFDPRG
ncbi:MAG TPA: ABC transporter permease [Alphaproteobacteria bacterium]|nr:ABC transporter permease [Alphaproteobacteria bacterium]